MPARDEPAAGIFVVRGPVQHDVHVEAQVSPSSISYCVEAVMRGRARWPQHARKWAGKARVRRALRSSNVGKPASLEINLAA
jgi:hypothetical protein